MSEFEQIRDALGMTLEQLGKALGAKSHSTVHRWESSPDTPSSRKALEKAKDIYRKKKGAAWVSPAAAGPAATREEVALLRADLEDACEVIRFLLTQLPEGSRPGVLPKRFR